MHLYLLKTLFTYGLLFFTLTAATQSFQGNLKLENITFPEGNQLAYVYDIAQDSTGLIWMRANWDIYTYNGHELAKLGQEVLGFPANNTRWVFADPSTPDFYFIRDTLVIFDPVTRKIKERHISEDIINSVEINLLAYIGVAQDGALWSLGNKANHPSEKFVLRAEKGEKFKVICPLEVSWYYDQTLTIGDNYYVKLRDRIEVFGPMGRVQTYSFPPGPDPVMPSMVKDAENTLWVVHSPDKSKDQYAVYYLKEGQDEFVRLPRDKRFVQEAKHGQLFADGEFIWHRGYPFRLSRMCIKDGSIVDFTDKIIVQSHAFPFYNSTLLNMFRDRSGQLWLTTRAGMVKMTIEKDIFKKYTLEDAGLKCQGENCQIRAVAEDDDGFIYSSYQNGILKLNPQTGELSELPLNIPPQNQKEHALTYAWGTLFWNDYAIDLTTNESRRLFPATTFEYIAHGMDPEARQLWIGVNDLPFKFYRYDILTRETTRLEIPNDFLLSTNSEVRQIHFSKYTGTLFLSLWADGIMEIGLDGAIINRYKADPFSDGWQYSSNYGIYEDEHAQLWFGHGNEVGLSKLDLKTREITHIPYQIKSRSDPLKRVFVILPGPGDDLWLVTEKGTLKLNKKTGKQTRFPMFPTLSEMAYHRLPAFVAADGTFYIGTPDGSLNAFRPDELEAAAGFDDAYPVAINRLERFDENEDSLFVQMNELNDLSTIRLHHFDRFFNLEFFVPDYRNTGQILYTWWLEGYDKEWSTPTRINQLQYENLPPGKYTLHIRGGITPEFFKSSERTLSVEVVRAWYKRWWAFALYILGFLGLVYLYYQYQVNQQLEKAEAKRLKELNTLKSRLYTNITHEFRTPLTVIMGMTNNIKGHSQERKLIQRNSKNLLRLINQLLDLSKLDSGTLKMDKIQGDIVNYLQYLTESFYSMAEEKKIRLTFYPEVRELIMDFDEAKMQHIVYNLLTNAIKFTAEGGKIILHLQKAEIQGKEWLQMKVSDTGLGISEENLPKIFDRFYQGDASFTRREAGTGIGLTLTKELVGMMGGSIVVESELGKGTDFLLLFPIQLDPDTVKKGEDEFGDPVLQTGYSAPEDKNLVPLLELATLNEDSETPSLLIIEDNRDVVTYIESLLKKDYHIEIARDGQQGIDKALAMVPDIIISDVMMPEKDGYEVCETLKNDDRTSHIPIILLTAKATLDDRIEGLRGGADAYLVKPFHKEELFVRLEKLIELRKSLQQKNTGAAFFSRNMADKKAPSLDDLFLQKLIQLVQERLDDTELSVNDLCRAVRRSNTQVNRKLKALTGKTPSQFIRSIRLQKAAELLKTTDLNVSEIAYEVGFNDPNYFSRSFSEEFGVSPNAIRK
ncbi:MAG: response regulator [Saprospiraceae bacterium]|nr:response regulator [Saprospiraceae bacterium]MCB9325393.1 response regulator [Lewinellaceae bacterium]